MSTSAKVALLVVTAVCGVSMPLHRFGRQVEYPRHQRVAQDIADLDRALRDYHEIHGAFPPTSVGLAALPTTAPRQDPWQSDYVYICPGLKHPDGYDLFSAGSSRKPGAGTDDWGD